MPRESLYQLQSRWDDERTAQRVRALRGQIAPLIAADLRWLPIVFLLFTDLAIAFAAMTP